MTVPDLTRRIDQATPEVRDRLAAEISAAIAALTPPTLESLGFPDPHPAQQAALALLEDKRYVVLNWGRRAGKSELVLRWLAEGALHGEPCAYLYPDYPMLTGPEGVWWRLKERLGGVATRISEMEHSMSFPGGGSIQCWSIEGLADRVRGRKYQRIALDEAALMLGLDVAWGGALRATLIDLAGKALFVSTPRRGGAFQAFYDRDFEDWGSMSITTLDNPHLPPEEVPRTVEEALAAGMSEELWRREIMADFEASDSDLVYPEFNHLVHVRGATVGWRDCKWRVVGIDPGGGDPTAIVPLGVVNGESIHQYGEFYRRGDVTIEAMAEYLGRLGAVDAVVVGETGGNVITNTLRSLGFPAFKATMGRDEGLEVARWLLQAKRLTIDPSCVNSIGEFATYQWARRKNVGGQSVATRSAAFDHSDAMDARRYGAVYIVNNLMRPAERAEPFTIERTHGEPGRGTSLSEHRLRKAGYR